MKFGFAASTGAFTDVHLIRTLRMQAIDPEPALTLAKSVTPAVAGDVGEGAQLRYSFLVTNTGGGTVDDIVIDDPMLGVVTCPATSLESGASMTCTASYRITAADVRAGTITNVATVTGEGRGGPVPPQTATATISTSALASSGLDAPVGLWLLAGLLLVGAGALASRRLRTPRRDRG